MAPVAINMPQTLPQVMPQSMAVPAGVQMPASFYFQPILGGPMNIG